MTGQQTLIARAALGAVAGGSTFVLLSNSRVQGLPDSRFDRAVTAAFLLSRMILFALIFLVFGLAPRGDIPAYYWPEALNVLHGLLPYRDFVSSYAPLHPYLDALVIGLWHSPLAIILLAVLTEQALLPLWLRFGRRLFAEEALRSGVLLYLTSAVSLQFVTVDGQDTIIIGVLLTLALYFLARQREFRSGTSVGAAIATIKFLPLIYAPALFLAIPRRWRWLMGFLLPLAAVYGAAATIRLPIFTPLEHQADLRTAGNLPYLVEAISGVTLPARLWDGLLLGVIAAIFVLVVRACRETDTAMRLRAAVSSIAALTLALLFFSKKSWPPYLMLALLPICLLIDVRRKVQTIGFVCFSVVAVVEHSYWSSLLNQVAAAGFHRGLVSGESKYFVFLTLQILLLGGYGWLLNASLRRIAAQENDTVAAAPECLASVGGP